MVATKMFWDMWRNLTNATSNWTISSSTNSSSSSSSSWSKSSSSAASATSSRNKGSSRYNRLRSPPTKSYSQPANLAAFTATTAETTALDCLNDEDGGGGGQQTHQENINVGRTLITSMKNGKQHTIKHSFTTASFLPFTSSKMNPQSTQTGSRIIAKGISNSNNKVGSSSGNVGTQNVGRIPISCTENGHTEKQSELKILTNNVTATNNNEEARQQKEEFCVVEHAISDLDEDEDDGYHLTCDVCDRAFSTFKDLADHQRKKRHYGCLQCDTLFPNREGLDIHREQMCHYEFAIDLAGYRDYGVGDDDDTDSFITDDDENGLGYSDDGDDEEMERLL